MKVELTISGGLAYLPGLAKPVTIDGEALSAAEAEKLARLVAAARFFERPATPSAPVPGTADMQSYVITVHEDVGHEGSRRHTLRLADPVEDPDLGALLNFLRAIAKQLRAQR